jgi:iron complex outermembrane receptor protein
VRLASSDAGRWRWIVGAYHLQESLPGAYASYDPSFGPLGSTRIDFDQTTRNSAGFGSVTLRLTSALSGSLGVRYTDDHKYLALRAVNYTATPELWWLPGQTGAQLQYLRVQDSIDNGIVTGDASLKYRLKNGLLYARLATGFRGGVFNTAPFAAQDYSKVGPERLTSYEIGFKGEYLERRVRTAVDAFHYDYRNLQVYELLGASGVLANGADARVDGVEGEFAAYLTPAWLVLANAAVIDPRYTHFTGDSVDPSLNTGGSVDLTGLPLEKAARRTAQLLTSYSWRLHAVVVAIETDWRYSSFIKFREWQDAVLRPTDTNIDLSLLRSSVSQPGHTVGDVSVKATSKDQRLTVRAFVKNVTNKVYLTNSYTLEFNRSAEQMFGDPRVIGASIGVSF